MKELQDILSGLYYETMPGSFKAVLTIDQIAWCGLCDKDDTTELARTTFPHIVQAIVEGGRPTNRYVVTWEAVE